MIDDKNWTLGATQPGQPGANVGWNTAKVIGADPPASKPFGRLIARDPVKQKAAWTQEQISRWNGGTLTT